jgi:hypothetical protein
MRDNMRFALVLRTGTKGFAPDCPFDFGICFVEGDSARTSFVDFEDLERALGDFPAVPSCNGKLPGIVSFEAEMEAVDVLSEAASAFSTKYSAGVPQSHSRLRERLEGGIVVTIDEGRICFELGQWAAAALSWHIGDRVDMSISQDGRTFSVFADRDGTALVAAERTGWLSTTRDWPLPVSFHGNSGRHAVPLAIGGGAILFEIVADQVELQPSPLPSIPVPPLSHRLPIDYRWGPITFAVVYAFVAIALKIV